MTSARRLTSLLGDAFRLAKPYFVSEERWSGIGLLAATIALNLVGVYFNVVYTYWYKIAYNALQAKDASAFWTSMLTYRLVPGFPYLVPGFVENAACTIVAAVYAYYLSQMLQIRWRRWFTARLVGSWLERRAYYRIALTARNGTPLDNPDQRIAEDVRDFVSSNLTLGINFISNILTLVSFVGVLWFIGPPLRVGSITLHGYLVWVAVLYSIAGTYLTQLIGRRLVPLTFQQQQVEADFRFNLVRVRENTEQIALYGGESAELQGLTGRFTAIFVNWWQIMKRTKALNFFTIGFAQVAIIFPVLVAAPNYFSGIFTLGVVMQIARIFENVQGSLSWFVTSYPDLVTWRATVQRLDGFERAVREAHAQASSPALTTTTDGETLRLEDLEVDVPDGRHLFEQPRFAIDRGEPLAIAGPSGAGKSTLLRVIAGIWPFARGRVTRPRGTLMFLPQRPYVPIGSLKAAVAYPMAEDDVAEEVVRDALDAVGLGALAHRLADADNWALRLSGGEQQRLALSRVLIAAPDWLFLDEATSALDESAVASLFSVLRKRLPKTQIVSITHQRTTEGLHERRAVMSANGATQALTVLECTPRNS